MGVGRFVCVAVPFALTLASLICIIIVCLAGVTSKGSLYLLELDTANLSISSTDIISLITKRGLSDLTSIATAGLTGPATNITAADLGLGGSYKAALWNYCVITGTNTTCSAPAFNWAASATNTTGLTTLAGSVAGQAVELPDTISGALKTFSTILHWTEIVYIIAAIVTVFELFVGLFALCSRIGSCCTFIISGVSTVAIIAASILATVLASVTVGTINTVAKEYGVEGTINKSFLSTTWLAVAFSLASGIFWMMSICCCGGSSGSSRGSRGGDREKGHDMSGVGLTNAAAPFGGYQRVHDPYAPEQQSGIYNPQPSYNAGQPAGRKTTGAYEPYSHGAV